MPAGLNTMFKTFTRRSRLSLLVVLPLLSGGLTGCVGQGDWDRLYETNRSLTDQNQRLRQEADEARSSAELLRQQLGRTEAQLADLKTNYAKLLQQLGMSEEAMKNLQNRFGSMQLTALDADTDAALRELAAKYPDLIQYDSALGMLRFASDLTFASGSDQVAETARASLRALAEILKSGPAQQYDGIIVGHTDGQRISSRTAATHPTNRHLSVHRSISVINELISLGVPAQRLQAAGWGEFRPRVANTGSGNTPENRRVEIYLTKPKSGSNLGIDASATPAAAAPGAAGVREVSPEKNATPTRQPEITK
jgi:chemotaxis protein MotB